MQDAKKSTSERHRTNLSGYIFPNKARIDNRKKNLLSSNISSTGPHNMVNFGLLAAEILSLLGAAQLISTAFASWLRYCSDVAQRKPTKLHGVWPSPGLVHYVHFRGFFSVTEFCQVQKSLCILEVLRSRILVALLHGS